jgi:hypothetical protein
VTRQAAETNQGFDTLAFFLTEAVATGMTAKIIDLAAHQPPEWGAAASGIGVIALTFSGIAAHCWGNIQNASITGSERKSQIAEK